MSLVITRKVGESYICQCKCGEVSKHTVGKIDNNKARICIDADKQCKIARSELIERANESIPEFFERF